MIVRMYVVDEKNPNSITQRLNHIDADIPHGFFVDEMVDIEKIEKDLGRALRLALKRANIILIRKMF